MKGNPEIIAALNARLSEELAAISQYEAHRAALTVQQYPKLVAYLEERIADEYQHHNRLSERIRFLEGEIDAGTIAPVTVGGDIRAMLFADLNAELDAVSKYRDAIRQAFDAGDHGTRAVLESILIDEEDHTRDLEARILQIEQMTVQNFLSSQL